MLPQLIITLEAGVVVSVETTGRLDVLVHDRDIRFLPAAVDPIEPTVLTLTAMAERRRQLAADPVVPNETPIY